MKTDFLTRRTSVLLSFGLSLLCPLTLAAQLANPKQLKYDWKTDTTRHKVELSELSMMTGREAIPSLDFPKFIRKDHPSYAYYDFEPAIVVQFGGEARAYPLSVLTLFELSNDSLGGKNIMVTFCPLCNAAMVFDRTVKTAEGPRLLHFGVSGILMHNDMVMYDRETESWWEQIAGEGIVGTYSGTELKMLPALLISLKDYFSRYPEGEVLSPEYQNLEKKKGNRHRAYHHLEHTSNHLDKKYYLPEKYDTRLAPLEHVLDLHIYGHDKIYPFTELSKVEVLNDTIATTAAVIFYHADVVSVLDNDQLAKSKKIGSATAFDRHLKGTTYTFKKSGEFFTDAQTGSVWDITGYCREGKMKGEQLWILPQSNHFAFAYLAFFPEVEIYSYKP